MAAVSTRLITENIRQHLWLSTQNGKYPSKPKAAAKEFLTTAKTEIVRQLFF